MIHFLDVYERCLKGPLMSEDDFNMKVFYPALTTVVKEYGIKYDKKNPVPVDDKAADNLYDAAVDFLSQVGVYCLDTNRIIQFTKDEILEAVKEAPGKCYLGEGKDAGVFDMRKPDDSKLPWFEGGWSWVCTTEEKAINYLVAVASIPETNALKPPAWKDIRGIPFTAGSPGEMYAAIRAVRIGREAARQAGRPGMPIPNAIGTAASAVATIGASAPQFGLRPTDGWLCGAIAEMKTGFEAMNKVAYLLNWGANIASEIGPILGGYCGGPEGTAVVNTAYIMMGLLVFKANYHLSFPCHFRNNVSTTRDVLWVVSSACQAISRNIPSPVSWVGFAAAGPNTKMFYYEAAAYLLCAITSGAAGLGTPHGAKSKKIDGATPLEPQFVIDLAKAACELNRGKANELVIKLLEKYESQIPKAPEGDTYQDCYDVVSGKPGGDCLRLYDEVKEELAGMEIPLE